jgi:purine-binding chemotaxis protein CheW
MKRSGKSSRLGYTDMITAEQQQTRKQYLSFSLGDEEYGIDIHRVREIKGWEEVRPLPDTPDYVNGVLDLRGAIVPIIDLRIRFDLQNVEYSSTTVFVVVTVQSDSKSFMRGIVVDSVSDVLDVNEDGIKPAPKLEHAVSNRYISGVVTIGERMVVLLDLDRLFGSDELEKLDNVV